MSNIQMIKSNLDEVFHLFSVMDEYGAKCSLELIRDDEPLLCVVDAPVRVSYFENDNGPDSIIMTLGDIELYFEIGAFSFAKYIHGQQILVSAIDLDGRYAARFESHPLTQEGLEAAKNYSAAPAVTKTEEYTTCFPGGTKAKLNFSVELADPATDDYREVLGFISASARQFYLSVGREINSKQETMAQEDVRGQLQSKRILKMTELLSQHTDVITELVDVFKKHNLDFMTVTHLFREARQQVFGHGSIDYAAELRKLSNDSTQ